jgi:DNA-binding MarR family transcriptional regulator
VQTPRAETLEAWAGLLTAHRHLTFKLDGELRQRADMTLDDYDVLYQLRQARSPVRMSDLARMVVISRPSTTRVVDRLVERGWLRRWHDDDDRRVVMVELTDAGRHAQSRAARLHLDGIARYVEAPLCAHDVPALAAALRALAVGDGPDGAE